MDATSPDSLEASSSFNFYQGYLSVIYGLVATSGLKEWSGANKDSPFFCWLSPPFWFFLGIFVIGLHFWYVCMKVDETSGKFYRLLPRKKNRADLFLLFDALVATAFAGIVWDMFKSFSPTSLVLPMEWFVIAAGASVLYDLYSTVLIACAKNRKKNRKKGDDGARVVSNYAKTVKYWLAQDGTFLVLAMLLWWAFSKWGQNRPLVIAFTLVCIGVLVGTSATASASWEPAHRWQPPHLCGESNASALRKEPPFDQSRFRAFCSQTTSSDQFPVCFWSTFVISRTAEDFQDTERNVIFRPNHVQCRLSRGARSKRRRFLP